MPDSTSMVATRSQTLTLNVSSNVYETVSRTGRGFIDELGWGSTACCVINPK